MNVVALIQARMSSTRLPGKVILPIGDLPAIVHTYRRVKSVVDQTYVIFVDRQVNAPLERCCREHGVQYRVTNQPEDDVLARYYEAAHALDADWVIRITGDCPFIDPYTISYLATQAIERDQPFTTNISVRMQPRGLDVEILSRDLLDIVHYQATEAYDREHVTPYIYRSFPVNPVGGHVGKHGDLSHYRWVLDHPNDYEFFQAVATRMRTTPPNPTATALARFLKDNPDVERMCLEPV